MKYRRPNLIKGQKLEFGNAAQIAWLKEKRHALEEGVEVMYDLREPWPSEVDDQREEEEIDEEDDNWQPKDILEQVYFECPVCDYRHNIKLSIVGDPFDPDWDLDYLHELVTTKESVKCKRCEQKFQFDEDELHAHPVFE